jgi:hypothetical protein
LVINIEVAAEAVVEVASVTTAFETRSRAEPSRSANARVTMLARTLARLIKSFMM